MKLKIILMKRYLYFLDIMIFTS